MKSIIFGLTGAAVAIFLTKKKTKKQIVKNTLIGFFIGAISSSLIGSSGLSQADIYKKELLEARTQYVRTIIDALKECEEYYVHPDY